MRPSCTQRPVFESITNYCNEIYEGLKSAYLILRTVLDDLSAEVRALDGPQILLVTLRIAGILVKHVWGPRLYLRFDYGVPQCLRLDLLLEFSLFFVPGSSKLIVKNDKLTFLRDGPTQCKASRTPLPSSLRAPDTREDT